MENDIDDCSMTAKINKGTKRNKLQHVDDNNIVAVVKKLKAVSQQKILRPRESLYVSLPCLFVRNLVWRYRKSNQWAVSNRGKTQLNQLYFFLSHLF